MTLLAILCHKFNLSQSYSMSKIICCYALKIPACSDEEMRELKTIRAFSPWQRVFINNRKCILSLEMMRQNSAHEAENKSLYHMAVETVASN